MKIRSPKLDAATARALLNAIIPQEGETIEEAEAHARAYWRVQMAIINGPHSQELAQLHTQAFAPGIAGDVAFKKELALLRVIVEEESPQLVGQFDEEAKDGRFDAKRNASRRP